ncbi:hypothetical protein K438DRAFT_1580060 [Mycena galopus ATCC 62051]|nr:hypothetical protein K438DRAFT_1580060 [Mycena galopus ATCC 62051]
MSDAFIAAPNDCNDLHQCRTLWNIIWSCLATIFACIWVSLHMDIIPCTPPDSPLLRKLRVAVAAIIAPEMVIYWATIQHIAARRITKDNPELSMTHAFFILMGGFVDGDASDKPIPVHRLSNVHSIPKKEIQGRSKADALSKAIVVLQTAWFITQCIARRIRHLPLTTLEIFTAAFAVLCLGQYLLWWNKPLDVRLPFIVTTKADNRVQLQDDPTSANNTGPGNDTPSAWVWLKDMVAWFCTKIKTQRQTTQLPRTTQFGQQPSPGKDNPHVGLVERSGLVSWFSRRQATRGRSCPCALSGRPYSHRYCLVLDCSSARPCY